MLFRYFSAVVYCTLLVCWPQKVDATGFQQQLKQDKYVVSGFVVDAENSESLVGATVYAPELRIGATTNQYGFFSLSVSADSVRLVISHVGYLSLTLNQVLTEDIRLNIELSPQASRLDEVEVIAVGQSSVEAIQMSQIKLPVETIRALPVLLGETDILKTLQLLPGVQSGREGTAGLYIRGGTPDQNLILLDGVTVYNPSHLFGFLSVFNSDVIKDVTLIKGGVPARYGGRLSSVIDLTMEEGNMKEFEGTATVGILASSFTFQGPVKKDKASFIIAARRTYIDALVYPFLDKNNKVGYYFYDTSAKINYIISSKDRVYLSFYAGHDRAYSRRIEYFTFSRRQERSSLGWRNLTATARWNRVWGTQLFSNALLGYTRYRTGIKGQDEIRELNIGSDILSIYQSNYLSGITDIIGRMDFDWVPSSVHYVRFGAGGTLHTYNTGVFSERSFEVNIAPVDTVYNPDHSIRAFKVHTYVEDEIRILSNVSVNAGVRASGFFVSDRRYYSLQPRFNVRWKISDHLSLKKSFSVLKQNSHLLPLTNGLSLPLDLWVPATNQVRPQNATQVASGFAWSSPKRIYEITVEGFYKWMNHQIEYAEGARTYNLSGDSWQYQIERGKGWSYGGELFIRKSTGRVTGWVGYSLTKTQRKFATLNGGRTFPFRFDRMHDVSAVANWHVSPSIELSAVWVYGTGQAFWLPVGAFHGFRHDPGAAMDYTGMNNSRLLQVYGERNSVRMRAYHRLDVSMRMKRNIRWGYRTLSFGFYNAYSRRNPFLLKTERPLVDGYIELNYLIFKEVSAFPVIPFINYRLEF